MNFMISILGWLLWNWAEFTMAKADMDDDGNPNTNLSVREYANSHYPTWIGSLLCIPLLLWIGYRNLSIDPLASIVGVESSIGWNDLYLVGAGAAWEAFIFGVKKVRKFYKQQP